MSECSSITSNFSFSGGGFTLGNYGSGLDGAVSAKNTSIYYDPKPGVGGTLDVAIVLLGSRTFNSSN